MNKKKKSICLFWGQLSDTLHIMGCEHCATNETKCPAAPDFKTAILCAAMRIHFYNLTSKSKELKEFLYTTKNVQNFIWYGNIVPREHESDV